ncbi:hypothetical protein ACWPKO_16285 [Coraliomargarita sp. W4R53]
MSEKATLLTSIPPVKTTESNSSQTPLLSSTPVEPQLSKKVEPQLLKKVEPQLLTKVEPTVLKKVQADVETNTAAKVSLLSQTRELKSSTRSVESRQSEAVQSAQTLAAKPALLQPIAVEAVAEEPAAITTFQMVTYASFVFNFILAGAVAVILFKKAMKLAEERFVVSAKAMAIAGVLIMLHGFFATYLYAAHLNNTVSSAPLFLTMAIWVLVGPAVGFITRNLLSRGEKPNRKAAFVDAGIYALIFFLAACGVSSGIKSNAALLSSIMAGFLMIVPIARSLTAFNVARARHQELNEASDRVLIYALLILPALLPILGFANVCGLSDAVTLFLINFITFDFVLVVSLSLIASADEFLPEVAQSEASASAVKDVPVAATKAPQAVTKPVAKPVAKPATKAKKVKETPPVAPRPAKVQTGNPDDPIIQFLNGETDDDEAPSAFDQPAAISKPAARTLPPRKPGRPGITPPKKPGSAATATTTKTPNAPNAPSRLKAPAKPKKRF